MFFFNESCKVVFNFLLSRSKFLCNLNYFEQKEKDKTPKEQSRGSMSGAEGFAILAPLIFSVSVKRHEV